MQLARALAPSARVQPERLKGAETESLQCLLRTISLAGWASRRTLRAAHSSISAGLLPARLAQSAEQPLEAPGARWLPAGSRWGAGGEGGTVGGTAGRAGRGGRAGWAASRPRGVASGARDEEAADDAP
jgi:hypothetical protein